MTQVAGGPSVHPYAAHLAQIVSVLASWGMPVTDAERTGEVMAWADLHGIDSHGFSMLTVYHERWRAGRLNILSVPRVLKKTPVSVLVDGDGGLGHVPSRLAMEAAIARARAIGIGVACVRNSAHFGATGFYAKMASDAGFVGLATTSASGRQVAPTGGAEAMLGTDPIAFSAPARDGEAFLLDMATTTVAAGKIRNKFNEGLECPPGWVVTREGLSSTDPREAAEKGGFLTSLGGTAEGSSYKGYGLSAMVNILSACLSGSTPITSPMHMKQPFGQDIGHFFLALDPGLFRDPAEFRAEVAGFCDALRATRPVDADRKVMVAGDPERARAVARLRDGIPIAPGLYDKVRTLAAESGAAWLLN